MPEEKALARLAWLESEGAWQAISDGLEDAGLYNPDEEIVATIQGSLVTAWLAFTKRTKGASTDG